METSIMSYDQMVWECAKTDSIQHFQGWLVLCARPPFAVRLAESQWEKSIYSLMLSSCSACHTGENSNKVILSEDFKFSNAKYMRDYWCTTAEIKYTFQVALSTFFACTLLLTLYLLAASFRYLCYCRDFKLCCCLLSFWQQVTCFRNISSHSVKLYVLSVWVLWLKEKHSAFSSFVITGLSTQFW